MAKKLGAIWTLIVGMFVTGTLLLPTVAADLISNETQDDIIQLAVLGMILSILFGLAAWFRYRR